MSDIFEAAMANDWAVIISADGEFPELVHLMPRGKAARDVYAVVTRNPPAQVGPDGMVKRIAAQFEFRNHATAGITIAEARELTQVRFNVRKGDSSSREDMLLKLVSEPDQADAGTIRCEV